MIKLLWVQLSGQARFPFSGRRGSMAAVRADFLAVIHCRAAGWAGVNHLLSGKLRRINRGRRKTINRCLHFLQLVSGHAPIVEHDGTQVGANPKDGRNDVAKYRGNS